MRASSLLKNIAFWIALFLVPRPASCAEKPAPVRLAFAGDVMLDLLPGEDVAKGIDPFADFAKIFSAADLAVANLECVVATVGTEVSKPWTFRANPRVLPLLKKHFGALSLANNHTGDYGHAAFLQQLQFLKSRHLPTFGGGRDLREARTPYIFKRRGLRIALLGYCDVYLRSFEAGPNWPGVAWAVDEQIAADIQAARTIHHADIVIPFMHWGDEEDVTNERQKKLARLMIDSGADVVVGGHPHVVQDVEYYNGKLIVYSIGNFVFDGFKTPETNTGWVLRLDLTKGGLQAWDTIVLKLDERGTPHIATDVASPFGVAGSEQIENRRFRQ